MPKATPGVPYVVVPGDNLSKIAKQAYGEARRWREIYAANRATLRSGDPNLIFPGETIIIPGIPELDVQNTLTSTDIELPDKKFDELTILVDGNEIIVQNARIMRSMDTAADGFTAVMIYNVENDFLSELLSPYRYNNVKVYIGGRLIVTGRIFNVTVDVEENRVTKTLEGFTNTINIVDSTPAGPPFEFKKNTLEQIAKTLVDPFQVPVVFEDDPGGQFDKVTIEPDTKIFDFLKKLAKQRNFLVTSTSKGELLFVRAKTDTIVGSLEEGNYPVLPFRFQWNGRNRFNAYKGLSKRRGKKTKYAVSKDPVVFLSRFQTFSANDSTSGDIQKVTDWHRSKQVAESLRIQVPVSTLYSSDGQLWRENAIVTFKSISAYIPDGYNFLIRSVEFIYSNEGITAQLDLVPPEVYTGLEVIEPWLR